MNAYQSQWVQTDDVDNNCYVFDVNRNHLADMFPETNANGYSYLLIRSS
jgi:hypothetical protein